MRVYARAYDVTVEKTIRLREEHALVSRRPVDRPATDADLAALNQSGTLEVSERVKEPVVGKRARVVEEVGVRKRVDERTETVRDKVRKTDVRVHQGMNPQCRDFDHRVNTDGNCTGSALLAPSGTVD